MWVLLLKMSRDKFFSWLLLKSLLEKKIDTTVLNTYGFQNSWQIPLSISYKTFLFLSKAFVSPSHKFSTSSAQYIRFSKLMTDTFIQKL